jgi:hypothetical protein
MELRIDGPDTGQAIGGVAVRAEMNDRITLADLPGETLVVIMFRGHW